MEMVTDPQRMRRTDPGRPEVCNVFSMHQVFTPSEEVAVIDAECRKAGIGCVDCKKIFAKNLNEHLASFHDCRNKLAEKPEVVWDVLHEGAARARGIAEQTMVAVRKAVGLPE